MPPAWVPLLILVLALALLSVGRLPRFGARRHRAWVALGGGAAMLVVGAVPWERALAELRVDILALLLGMLALAATLEVAGFFDWLGARVVRAARTQARLLALTMAASAGLSALFLNDAVVLLLTPVLVKTARSAGVSAMPYLAGEALAANVGSVATPVGNPQNAYIAVASGLGFAEFAAALLPVAALGLLVAVPVVFAVFRRDLAAPLAAPPAGPPPAPARPRLLAATLAVLGAVLAGFLLGWGIAPVAFAGGLGALAAAALLAPRDLPRVARRVDLGVPVLFAGLFWLVAGVRDAGWSDAMRDAFLGGGAPTLLAVGAWAAVLSQLVSNVPAVLLVAPALHGAPPQLWLGLAAASTLAGNATLVGAAANVLVAETARAHGAAFSVRRFMLAGVPAALATLAIAMLLLGAGP